MFYIIQVCCIVDDRFKSFKICSILNYRKFIRDNYNEYKDFTYYIYDSNAICIDVVEF